MIVVRWLDEHFEETILIVLSSIMTGVIILQVFMRYVLSSSLSWSEELARYCFIWIVYIGISYAVKKRKHLKVDVLSNRLGERNKVILSIISNVIFLGFSIFVVIFGYDIFSRILGWGQNSPALQIPMAYVYLAAPFGFALVSIRIIQQLILEISSLLKKTEYEK